MFSIIVEKGRLRSSIESSLREIDHEGAVFFDDRFIYTDEHDIEHQILRIKWRGSVIMVLINDEEHAMRTLNLPMLTMLDYKIKNYVSDYLDN